jgi:hypothetical protein
VLKVLALHDWHFGRDPGERDVGLRAAKLLERGLSCRDPSGYTRRGGEDAVGAVRCGLGAKLWDQFYPAVEDRQDHVLLLWRQAHVHAGDAEIAVAP